MKNDLLTEHRTETINESFVSADIPPALIRTELSATGDNHPESCLNKRDKSLTLEDAIDQHLEALRIRHFSLATLHIRTYLLGAFCHWCESQGLIHANQITKETIKQYQSHLYHYRKICNRRGEFGQPLSIRGQQMRLYGIRVLFSWLAKNHFIPDSPALEIEMPREERRLPRYVFTAREAEQVLNRPKVKTLTGIRDRAILETLYSSAIRRGELLGLKVQEVDTERGLLRINQGKGGRDRVVPIGQRAIDWIERYRAEARSRWVRDENETALFLTKRGTRLSTNHVSALVRRYIKRANLGKEGSCHLFRHTCATVLLENGANIRHIQQLLGHASLETTQIYTHVTVCDLKQVHNQCHPTAQRPPSVTPANAAPPA